MNIKKILSIVFVAAITASSAGAMPNPKPYEGEDLMNPKPYEGNNLMNPKNTGR